MKTTGERPHLERGLPERGVSPIGCLRTELAHGQSDPHPSASIAESVRGALQSLFQAPAGFTSPTQIEPGHISLPKRAHPARQAHQPLGPETASRPQAGLLLLGGGAEATGRSRRQHPGGPGTLTRHTAPRIARRASALTAGRSGSEDGRRRRGQSHGNRGPSPSSRFRGVKAQTRNSTAEPRRTGFAYRFNSSPKSHQPPDQTPLDCSHLVSAHPPCSRKGPLLPARGQKCPRRVKRETTNSRFFAFLRGTWPKFWWESTDRKRLWGRGPARSILRPFEPCT